jgi:hypothetical protein
MNRLVDALLFRRDAVDLVTRLPISVTGEAVLEESVSFRQLLEALGDLILSRSEQRRLQGSPNIRRHLEEGYLPTISARDWENALKLARGRVAPDSGWWTVMVPATAGNVGLTIPQNDSRASAIALFNRSTTKASVLAYDPESGELSEIPGIAHCGPPSRGLCSPGLCHGCAPFQIYDKKTHAKGIKCICPDQSGEQ